MNSGSCAATVLSTTFSAPAPRMLRTSANVRTPPPTAKGMFASSPTSRTKSSEMSRFCREARMSRKTSSSALMSLKILTALMGSPTYVCFAKRTVFTSPPSRSSRTGMTLRPEHR